MLIDLSQVRIFLKPGKTDMRKSINGLSILVQDVCQKNAFSGDLFVFCNKRKNILKILYWDNTGFAIWQKRLEENRFIWPKNEQEVREIELKQLEWLLSGLDMDKAHRKKKYSILS